MCDPGSICMAESQQVLSSRTLPENQSKRSKLNRGLSAQETKAVSACRRTADCIAPLCRDLSRDRRQQRTLADLSKSQVRVAATVPVAGSDHERKKRHSMDRRQPNMAIAATICDPIEFPRPPKIAPGTAAKLQNPVRKSHPAARAGGPFLILD